MVRRGVLEGMASPLVRWIAMVALLASVLPQLAAGLMVLGDCQGEHELRCHFGARSVEVTMHHRNVEALPGESAMVHRHSWLEAVVVGRCKSDDEPDHHFVFGRQSVMVEEDDLRAQGVALLVAFEPRGYDIVVLEPCLLEERCFHRTLESVDCLSPPQLMRRGVMMRL